MITQEQAAKLLESSEKAKAGCEKLAETLASLLGEIEEHKAASDAVDKAGFPVDLFRVLMDQRFFILVQVVRSLAITQRNQAVMLSAILSGYAEPMPQPAIAVEPEKLDAPGEPLDPGAEEF